MTKHFTTFKDLSTETIQTLVEAAIKIKNGAPASNIAGKFMAMIFLNPSLRTRVSFESALHQFGGKAVTLQPGSDMWTMELEDGAKMNGTNVEHIKDSAPILSRYCNAIAMRSFSKGVIIEDDLKDFGINALKKYSTVPVISLESGTEHPCQALADMVTIKERLKNPAKKKFVLTWAPHIKPLPFAVPHSALFTGAYSGMDVTVAAPAGFALPTEFTDHAEKIANDLGGSISYTENQEEALKNADVIYAKAWGFTDERYGNVDAYKKFVESHGKSWMLNEKNYPASTTFLHCLPVRRNVEVSDFVLDHKNSAIIDQAENRKWAQAAVLDWIWNGAPASGWRSEPPAHSLLNA